MGLSDPRRIEPHEADAWSETEMNDVTHCGTCGRGKPMSSAVFGVGGEDVRWMMWTCGHTSRSVGHLDHDANAGHAALEEATADA